MASPPPSSPVLDITERGPDPPEESLLHDVPHTGNRRSTSQGGDARNEAARLVVGESGPGTQNVDGSAGNRNDPPSADDQKTKLAPDKPAKSDVSGWDYVYKRLQIYDLEMIKGYSEDIDNLLIFAGLFSAVLTAFLIEVYTQLQPDNTQLSIQLLSNISLQLQQISLNQAAPASIDALNMSFQADSHVVAINTLWFLSLILALASALLGIFVKQWLREYMAWPNISPVQHAIQLRKFRYDAFQKWKVPTIVTLVPGLLQLAVVLFFVGLVTLLWPIDTVVAGVCCAAAGLTISLATLTVLLPLFFDTCPYKTPFGWMILATLRPLYRLLDKYMPRRVRAQSSTWQDLELMLLTPGFRDYRSVPHVDSYAFDGWDHRDLALRHFERDPASSIASQFHSLLWLASHEEPGDGVIAQCISDAPGPRMRTRAALKTLDDSNLIIPKKYFLHGCWKAICELLGRPCVGPTIPAFDVLARECNYDDVKGIFDISYDQLLHRAFDSLTSFNDTQVILIFKLLQSGLDMLQDILFGDVDDWSYFYVNSLIMMTLIAGQSDSLHFTCAIFLLGNLANSSQSFRIDRVIPKISAIIFSFTKMIPFYSLDAKDMAAMLELACSCYNRDKFRSSQGERRRFWAAVSCVTKAKSYWSEIYGGTDHQRCSKGMVVFGDCLVDALSLSIEPGDGGHVAERDLRVDWNDLVGFLGYHSDTAPDCSRKVAKFISEAHLRGSFSDEMVMEAFIRMSSRWDAAWGNANDVYEYFGVNPTSGSGGAVGPSSDARPGALSVLLSCR